MKQRFFQFIPWLMIVPALIAAMMASQSLAAESPLPCRYEITAILDGPFCPQFGNAPVYARGLSNHDPPWVVGFYPECVIGPFKAFVWTGAGNVQPITFPGANIETSFAYDVTDTGLVVGAFAQSGQPTRGFIYDVASGSWTQVDPVIPAGGCVVRAANNAGIVVGNRTISQTAYNAFIYHNGVYTDLGVMNGPFSEAWAISENGTVAGWTGSSASANDAKAFIHVGGVTNVLPIPKNAFSSYAWAVNSNDQVGGAIKIQLATGGQRYRACLWTNGSPSNLGVLTGYRHSGVFGLSGDGNIAIGGSWVLDNGAAADVACIWRNGDIINLNDLISPSGMLQLHAAFAINPRNEILCEATSGGNQVAVVLRPIYAPLGDINLDCSVNVHDLFVLIADWGKPKSPADLNDDQIVNVLDLLVLIENWTFK